MSYKATAGLLAPMLDAAADLLDGGFIYVYAGPEPDTAGEALDMATLHTELAKLSVDGDGVTGLTFSAAVAGLLSKDPGDVWKGLIVFDGFDDAEATLTPTFFRFCPAADNGRTLVTTPRLQGSVGGPSSSANMIRTSDTMTDNGTNETGASVFNIALTSIG